MNGSIYYISNPACCVLVSFMVLCIEIREIIKKLGVKTMLNGVCGSILSSGKYLNA